MRTLILLLLLIASSCMTIPPAQTVRLKNTECATIYRDMLNARQERIGFTSALAQFGIISAALITGGSTGLIVGGLALLGIPVVWFDTDQQVDLATADWEREGCDAE